MKNILVEGWRGINHSYALVNQHQLLELKKLNVNIFHTDLPYFNKGWNKQTNANGFDELSNQVIRSIPGPPSTIQRFDITYRISFPYRYYPANSDRLYVFGTAEYQSIDGLVFNNDLSDSIKNPNVKIVTPSNWSKVGFLKSGFQEDQIEVIPHGIDPNVYKPISADKRKQARDILGLNDDDFAILSLGAITWNKGIDVLLQAFSLLRKKFRHIKLVLKDQSNLYGIFARDILGELIKEYPDRFSDEVISSIGFMSMNLTFHDLNGLYGCADCYISPYRAEGFNLTPLEAAASGVPIIVTEGGATDDYCHNSFAMKIRGKQITKANETYIEPNLDSLIEQMTILIEDRNDEIDQVNAVEFIKKNFTWSICTRKLVDSFGC